MSNTATEQVPTSEHAEKPDKQFGVSALLTGMARMWRGVVPAVVIIVTNAVIQALLTFWNPAVGLNVAFVMAFAISAAVLIVWCAVLSRAALAAVTAPVSLTAAAAGTVAVAGSVTIWVSVQWLLITAGLLISPILAVVVAVVTGFVPLAAADGHTNAMGANFQAIRDRPGRWLVTSLIVVALGAVMFLLSAVNVFFIHGSAASLIFWLVSGFVVFWLLTSYAAIYRSTRVGQLR